MRNMVSQENCEMSTQYADIMELRNERQDCLTPGFFFGTQVSFGLLHCWWSYTCSQNFSQLTQGRTMQKLYIGFSLKQQLFINYLVFEKHDRNREHVYSKVFEKNDRNREHV